uniref:Uncharacterized protein n=1 Tax=Oryza nivara TaxID=4536 RepID=A0A0E0I186_ORYNI
MVLAEVRTSEAAARKGGPPRESGTLRTPVHRSMPPPPPLTQVRPYSPELDATSAKPGANTGMGSFSNGLSEFRDEHFWFCG